MNRMACVIALVGVAVLSACAQTAPVVQGKVVAVEQGGGLIRVQDELKPEAEPLALDITTAEIGGALQPGALVRVVYRAGASSNQALRVMDLGRQQAGQ